MKIIINHYKKNSLSFSAFLGLKKKLQDRMYTHFGDGTERKKNI